MATIREGDRVALIVVDVQVGVVHDAWDAARIVDNIARAVDRARTAGTPIVWVQHADAQLPRDTPGWQWVPQLVPREGEHRVHKAFNSSFERTDLDSHLASLGVSHIVLAGAATNWCIRATAYGALERGYDVTLVGDAHTTGSMQLDDGQTIDAAHVVSELNLAMRWLEYPGRRNAVAMADEVSFATTSGAAGA